MNGNYREYKLENGLVVALQETPTQTIAAKLRVNYGSSHEREGEEGMAHFLEHCLVTGGSKKYDPIQADEIRGSFGMFNAFTNIGRTYFVGQMLEEGFEKWLDYISNHVFMPRFDSERINGERERVLREISDVKSDPMYPVNIEFNRVFYRGHPKGRFGLGKEEVVRNADLERIADFHSRGYNPNNIDLIVVGGLPENIEELIKQYFGSHPKGENTRKEFPSLTHLQKKIVLHKPAPERINADNPEGSSAQIFLAYAGPASNHPDVYAIRAMNQILGGDTNSLLFQNMGLKKGLAYNIETSYDGDYNVGELQVIANVSAKRINEAVNTIFEEIETMKTKRVDTKITERIKRMAKYSLAKTLESNEGHISAIDMKLDEGLTPKSFMEGWDRVTPGRVQEAAKKYLPSKDKGKYILYIRDPLKNNHNKT